MKVIEKQNFYQGQRVGPEEMNALTAYSDSGQEHLVSSLFGPGLVQGYHAEVISGFTAGIAPGMAYNTQGQRLYLPTGVQVNLAEHTPAVGSKVVRLGIIPELVPGQTALDSLGNSVYKNFTENVAFVHGESLPAAALPLYEVQLSPVGISAFLPIFPILEAHSAISARTKEYHRNNGSPKIVRSDGFIVDLINGRTTRALFDPLKSEGYKKGAIIWLEPPTYDTLQTPPVTGAGSVAYPYTVPAAEAFMSKARTYSAQTNFRQYAVRLRALKDNPRNPAEVGAIGSDWAIDDPSAIVEVGSNANGSYIMYAGGNISEKMIKTHTGQVAGIANDGTLIYPVVTSVHPMGGFLWTTTSGGGNYTWGHLAEIFQDYLNDVSQTQCVHTTTVSDISHGNATIYLTLNSKWY